MSSSYILTISQLMTTQAMISQQMALDTAALQPLINPSSNNLNPAFMNWAAGDFSRNTHSCRLSFQPQGMTPEPESGKYV